MIVPMQSFLSALQPMSDSASMSQSLEASFASILAELDNASADADPTAAMAFDAEGVLGRAEPTLPDRGESGSSGTGRQAQPSASVVAQTSSPAQLPSGESSELNASRNVANDSLPLTYSAHSASVDESATAIPGNAAELNPALASGNKSAEPEREPLTPRLIMERAQWRVTVADAGQQLDVIAGVPGTSIEFQERVRQVLRDELHRAGIVSYRIVVNGRDSELPVERTF